MQFSTIFAIVAAVAGASAAAVPAKAATTTAAAVSTAVPESTSYSCKCTTAANVPDKAATTKACAALTTDTKFTFAMNTAISSCDARDSTSKRLALGIKVKEFQTACAAAGTGLTGTCQ